MSTFAELLRIVVPAVIVPLTIFGVNWAWRYERGYTQTAAADFILAVLIFDGAVIASSGTFEPFVRNSILRTIVVVWHMALAAFGGVVWALILAWGEPVVSKYFQAQNSPNAPPFPFRTFALCWIAVLALICLHVLFFVYRGGAAHG